MLEDEQFKYFLFSNNVDVFKITKDRINRHLIPNNYNAILPSLFPLYKHYIYDRKLRYDKFNNRVYITNNLNDVNPLYNKYYMKKKITVEELSDDRYKIGHDTFSSLAFITLVISFFNSKVELNFDKLDRKINKEFTPGTSDLFMKALFTESVKAGFLTEKINDTFVPKIEKNNDPFYYTNLNTTKTNLLSLNIENQIKILHSVLDHKNIVLTGSTGVGKTSQVPKLLWWFNFLFDGYHSTERLRYFTKDKIEDRDTILSLPRKVLITSTASNYFHDLGFSSITGSPIDCVFKDVKNTEYHNKETLFKNKLVLVIHRLLLDLVDGEKSKTNTIIIDEVHEHDTFADISSSILYKALKKKYKNLYLMTATLEDDKKDIIKFFRDDISFTHIEGPTLFKITTLKRDPKNLEEIIKELESLGLEPNKSVIIFKPSKSQVYATIDRLQKTFPEDKYSIIATHSGLDIGKLIKDTYGNGKITLIVSTPILESSITVANAFAVIDDNLFYTKHFNTGKILDITKSMQVQRKGRVGRVSDGYYITDVIDAKSTYKKIDHEYLYPYVLFAQHFNIKFYDFITQPTNYKRFEDTVRYLQQKDINVLNDIYYQIYVRYPISMIEYLLIYPNLNKESKKRFEEFDETQDISKLDSDLVQLLVTLCNVRLELVGTSPNNVFNYRRILEFEDREENIIKYTGKEGFEPHEILFQLGPDIFEPISKPVKRIL